MGVAVLQTEEGYASRGLEIGWLRHLGDTKVDTKDRDTTLREALKTAWNAWGGTGKLPSVHPGNSFQGSWPWLMPPHDPLWPGDYPDENLLRFEQQLQNAMPHITLKDWEYLAVLFRGALPDDMT